MAGKAARCACGAIVHVPKKAMTVAVGPVPSVSTTLATQVSTSNQVDDRHQRSVIDYQGITNVKPASPPYDLADRIRDIYLPTGLLILGFLTSLVWIVHQGRWGTRESMVIFELAYGAMLIKVAILSLLAWLIASKTGGSFGTPAATILKISALVVLLDAVFLWLRTGMIDTRMMSPSGRGPGGTIVLQLLVLVFTALFVTHFIYKLDDEEATTFGCLMAIGNVVVNTMLVLAVAAGLHLLIAAKARTATVVSLPPTNKTLATVRSSDTAITPTTADRQIANRISLGIPVVFEGREWKQMFVLHDSTKPMSDLIDQMYAAGALKVYIDMAEDPAAHMPEHHAAKAYVELPIEGAQRTACAEVARAYRGKDGLAPVFPTAPATGKFLTIDLRK
jgi:hypothetical protein